MAHTGDGSAFAASTTNSSSAYLLEIVPEWVPVLFRAGTMSLWSGLGTFSVPEPDRANHFR